jgi:pimeloyl-ACP methyl ester carboxylesterase
MCGIANQGASMNHKTTISKRGIIHYWVKGDSDNCIVFTHGATMDHELFQPQMEYFSPHYKVISWDVPLHGQSRPYQGFSLRNAASELVQILNAETVDKAHLVGQSMGGYVIQIVALEHPDRVHSLAAVDSSPLQSSYYSAIDTWLLSITPSLLRLYPYNTLIKTIATQVALDDSARSYALEALKGLTKAEIVNIMEKVYRGVTEYDRDFYLPHPLLIVYGDLDRTGKVRSYCNQWAKREKRAIKIIPNAAHNSNMDNPDEFNKILDEFLRTA